MDRTRARLDVPGLRTLFGGGWRPGYHHGEEVKDHGVHVLELVLGITRTPAMERAGLNFDLPGLKVSEPADVAEEGLARLKDGPVWIVEGNYETARQRTGFPRGPIVEGEAGALRKLMGR